MKVVLGLLVLVLLGLGYGKFNEVVQEQQENTFYSYISYSFPGNVVKSIQIKQTPESKCEKWRKEYFVASSKECQGCTVLANDCRNDIPEIYKKAFDQQNIALPFIYKPYQYPEVTIYDGLSDGSFSQLCAMEQLSLKDTLCFE